MVKKAKKRGVKPGTKRGPYKTAKRKRKPNKILKGLKEAVEFTTSIPNAEWRKLKFQEYTDKFMAATEPPKYSPAQPLTLCGQLEDSILLLETRISNAIAKINSLM